MVGSLWIGAGDDARVPDTGCGEPECSHWCMREGQVMGESPGISAGDCAPVAHTDFGELECGR